MSVRTLLTVLILFPAEAVSFAFKHAVEFAVGVDNSAGRGLLDAY